MRLVQFHPQQLLHQRRVAELMALPQRQRRQLGVEYGGRGCAAQVKKEFQILMRGVQHLGDGGVVKEFQQGVQRRERQRINAGDPVGSRKLDQAELGIKRLFADEFGIQCEPRRATQAGAEIGQGRLINEIEKIAHSRRQTPDWPPLFSSRRMSVSVMPRSTALHMS